MNDIIHENDLGWLAFLLCFSFTLFAIVKASKVAPGKETLLAYVLTSLINHIYFTTTGLSALCDGTISELSTDAVSRMSPENIDLMVQLSHTTYAYEIFNTMAAIVIPEYRTAEFLGHHILTAVIAKFSQTEGPDFYGFFFFGIASLSTLCLVFVDVFRHGPAYLRDTFPAVNTVAQVLFAVFFLIIRAFIWPLVSLLFWHDTIYIIRYPPESRSPYRTYLFILLFSNTFLSALQMLWAKRICKRLFKILKKSPESAEVKSK